MIAHEPGDFLLISAFDTYFTELIHRRYPTGTIFPGMNEDDQIKSLFISIYFRINLKHRMLSINQSSPDFSSGLS